jgi:serine/threonine protein kinase
MCQADVRRDTIYESCQHPGDCRANAFPWNMDELDLGQTVRGFAAGQRILNRYTFVRILGRGGMGVVWLARDDELEREVALKFLPELVVHDRAMLEDLKRETRRSLALTHHNIVRIYDFAHGEECACISMEYVDGATLSSLRIDQPDQVFQVEELGPLMQQVCDALQYAHAQARIVHRDLKPSNLMVNARGEVKVADFGIARSLTDSVSMLTKSSGASGTLVYMSPQQLDGDHSSELDDIYSLGATIYELLTGKPPFYSGQIDRLVREKVPPTMAARRTDLGSTSKAVIPRHWEEAVAACLAKEAAARPQSALDLKERLLFPTPALVLKTPLRQRLSPPPAAKSEAGSEEVSWIRRHPAMVVLAVGLIALLVAGIGWLVERRARGIGNLTKVGPDEEYRLATPAPTLRATTAPFLTPTSTSVPTPAVLFSDSFDDNVVDLFKWSASGSTVSERGGVMRVETNFTDKGGVLKSTPFLVQPNGEITIRRKVYLHRGGYVYMPTFRVFIGSLPPFGIHYCDINWNDSIRGTTYIQRHGIHISRNNANPHIAAYNADVSEAITPIWDHWFDEEIRYNPATGALSYFVNGARQMDYSVGVLPDTVAAQMSMQLDSWGWFTGHTHWMDDLIVSQK